MTDHSVPAEEQLRREIAATTPEQPSSAAMYRRQAEEHKVAGATAMWIAVDDLIALLDVAEGFDALASDAGRSAGALEAPSGEAIAIALWNRFQRMGGPLESWTFAMWRREVKAAYADAERQGES